MSRVKAPRAAPARFFGKPAVAAQLLRATAIFLSLQLTLLPGVAQAQATRPAVPPAQPAAPAAAREKVAVMDLASVGATRNEVEAVSDRLREELLKTGRFQMWDRNQMAQILREREFQQGLGCTTQDCAIEAGKILGARKLIVGKLNKISEGTWLVTAQLIDLETSETLRAESLSHRGDFFSLMSTLIVDLAKKLAQPSTAEMVAAQPAQPPAAVVVPPAQPAEPPKKEESKGGSSWVWWVLGGVAVVAVIAAGNSGSKSSSSSSSSSGGSKPCSANCASLTSSW